MEFPTIFYKTPGPHHAPKGKGTYAYIGVENQESADALLKEGWHPTLQQAVGDAPPPEPAAEAPPVAGDNAPPTRAEMEEMATALGLKFTKRTKDEQLLADIDKATGGE